MVVMPEATAVASPLLSTVATDGSEEVQMTCAVISLVVPSEYVPKAVNCWEIFAGTLQLVGVTATETRIGADPPESGPDDPEFVVPAPPPHPA